MNEGDELENAAGFISELEIMDRARNYNRWIFENTKPFLGSNILEVGCGIGTFTAYLVQTDAKVTAIDIDERCVLRVKERIEDEVVPFFRPPAIRDRPHGSKRPGKR